MTTRYADNGGVRIAFEDLGGTGGDPLLLIMGLGTSRFWWPDGLVDALVRQGFHVVAFDQRDAGESTRLPDHRGSSPLKSPFSRTSPAYTAEDLTDDAVAVLDALGWQGAHLVGHSLGGLVAQRIAIRHPGRVLSLTSSSAIPSDAKGLRLLRYARLATVRRFARLRYPQTPEGNLEMAAAVARILSAPGQAVSEADVREFVEKEAAHQVTSFRDAQAQSRQVGAKWHGGDLSQIGTPTLIMHGEQDPLLRVRAARDLASAIPGARMRILSGTGHYLGRETWPAYASAVRELVDRHAQPA